MGTFKIGQKIVCIDDSNFPDDGNIYPKKGKDYTIRAFKPNKPAVLLNEIVNDLRIYKGGIVCEKGFYLFRFRPLIDESFGERICAEITEQVKSEELVYD